MKRCRSYFRGRGVFVYHDIRCERDAPHPGQPHEATASFLNPHAKHVWGRA